MPSKLAEIMQLTAAHGTDAVLAALQPAVEFHRWRAADIRSILAAGGAAPTPRPAGEAMILTLPTVPTPAAVGVQGQHKRRRQLMATTTPGAGHGPGRGPEAVDDGPRCADSPRNC